MAAACVQPGLSEKEMMGGDYSASQPDAGLLAALAAATATLLGSRAR